ncbi:CPBP family intramembrane metalloprotease [Nonomuraea glycinis]|uniref:CAAX amino protease n=1 Tax=Nonomuraea glycinis TaxID=2047744 RepID=A0A918A341_9ACTN|nr:type II CAAX endopeptidase family protein [Nonomuraea glycinis]MCA2176788.1 CPBP family intramembrane metalloprotease [Nonomuraea glycinis]GGP03311.1 CAAX amino protease [Nonomuraea glycinis]
MSTTPTPQQVPPTDGRMRRIARFPLTWMLIGLVGVSLVSALTASGPAVIMIVGAAAAIAVYWAVMRFVAGRPTPEIARAGAGREALLGAGVGLGFMLVSALLIAILGGYSFSWSSGNPLPVVFTVAATAVGAAVTEELMFRGLALQALERLWGSRAALAITALLFGALHLGNPAATAWSSLAIALEAGVLLGAAYLWRRNIWFVVGLHFAWNTTVGLLGIPVSGHASPGLLTTEVTGPALLTGGGFGIEASIVPVIVSVLLTIPMLVLAHRRGGLVRR